MQRDEQRRAHPDQGLVLLEHGLFRVDGGGSGPDGRWQMATSPGWEGSQHRARTGTNGEKHEGLKARRSVHTDTKLRTDAENSERERVP